MKIKGHTTILLKDQHGNVVERHEDDNMVTNAISEYLANCGFLNFPNCDQNGLVAQLLGGIMCFDGEIDEDADIIKVPSGLHMIANGALGRTAHDENVTELGRVSTRADETGWQDDGSFLMTFNWDMAYGIGTIACVCLTNQFYALAGDGNSYSGKRLTSGNPSLTSIQGNVTSHSGFTGYNQYDHNVFNYDIENSTLCVFDWSDRATTGKGVIRKFRVPASMVNLKGTQTSPILLDEIEVTLDEYFLAAGRLRCQALGDNLMIWNVDSESEHTWGTDFTQYLWTLTPSGTLTRTTLLNTSGDTLHGIQNAIFDGDYIFFCPTHYWYIYDTQWRYYNDTRTIYIMKRSTGVITKVTNAYGDDDRDGNSSDLAMEGSGWMPYSSNGEGRVYISGKASSYVVDGTLGEVWPTNSQTRYGTGTPPYFTAEGLINNIGPNLYRNECFIASINNLATPVVKDGTKTMVIQYRLTFEDTEENAIGEIGGGVS